MGEHRHGSMDIREHERTFAGFIRLLSWAAGIVFAILIFLALANS